MYSTRQKTPVSRGQFQVIEDEKGLAFARRFYEIVEDALSVKSTELQYRLIGNLNSH